MSGLIERFRKSDRVNLQFYPGWLVGCADELPGFCRFKKEKQIKSADCYCFYTWSGVGVLTEVWATIEAEADSCTGFGFGWMGLEHLQK